MSEDEKKVALVGIDMAIRTLDDNSIYDSLLADGFSDDFIEGFQYAVECLCWMQNDLETGLATEADFGTANGMD